MKKVSSTDFEKAYTKLTSRSIDLFVTAGRDGSIFLFDTRCATQIHPESAYAIHTPVNAIRNAHVPSSLLPSSKSKRVSTQIARQVNTLLCTL